MAILEIKNFSKSYRAGVKAVDDLSLAVEPGEIYGFIGHNGAGKTTTIRADAGVMDFEEGEIIIDGHSVKDEPLLTKSAVAYIPNSPDIYEYITGIQYLNFIGDMFGVKKAGREKSVSKFAGVLEMTGALGDLVGSYSHGMRQKLALIGAFMHEPRLMVLDEPFVGLDPHASFNMKNMMRGLCDSGGAIFFSTHVLEVAEKLCDGIAIIKNGRLAASGKTDEVLKNGGISLEELFLEVAARDA